MADPEPLAWDLAAVYYAATLRPDPTLELQPDPEAVATYHATGLTLARMLLTPQRRAYIRCRCATRDAHPERPARTFIVVCDRRLVLARSPADTDESGTRVTRTLLADLPMLQREGTTHLTVTCHDCFCEHRLPSRQLRKAHGYTVSDRRAPYVVTPGRDVLTPYGDPMPEDPASIYNTAFAQVIAPAHSPAQGLRVSLPWLRAFFWRHTFGLEPPLDRHFDRLAPDADYNHATRFVLSRSQPADLAAFTADADQIRKAHAAP